MDVKTLALGTSLGLMISGIAWWSSRGTSGQVQPSPSTVASVEVRETVQQSAVSAALQAETVQLRQSLHALEKQLRQLAASQAASVVAEAQHKAGPTDTALVESVQQLENQVAALADRQKSTDLTATEPAAGQPADHAAAQDLALTYNMTLENETRDTIWEGERQSHFERFFHAREVAGARLQVAECRTTLCRLQVTLDDQQAKAQLMHSMSALLEADAEGALVMEDDNALHVTVYLSRSGHTLPAQALQSAP